MLALTTQLGVADSRIASAESDVELTQEFSSAKSKAMIPHMIVLLDSFRT